MECNVKDWHFVGGVNTPKLSWGGGIAGKVFAVKLQFTQLMKILPLKEVLLILPKTC